MASSFAAELRELSDAMPGYCADQARKLSELGAKYARDLAPMGKEVDEKGVATGQMSDELRKSITPDKVVRRGNTYSAGFTCHASYGSYVNDGTRAHIIRPRFKKALRFFDKGEEVITAVVHHPGFRGVHFMELGAARAEREWREQADADLTELVRSIFR